MNELILALVLGVLFGFALNKAGLTRYTKIVNVFRLSDMAVLKFMMTALVVTMIGVYPLRLLGIDHLPNRPGHVHRGQPRRRPDLRCRHVPGRILPGHHGRGRRRRQARLSDPRIPGVSGRRASSGA